MHTDDRPCRHCGTEVSPGGKCPLCGRPQIQDPDYVDELEGLAWQVVNAAYDEWGDGFRDGAATGSELQRSLVRLADVLNHWHYAGDGCLDAD